MHDSSGWVWKGSKLAQNKNAKDPLTHSQGASHLAQANKSESKAFCRSKVTKLIVLGHMHHAFLSGGNLPNGANMKRRYSCISILRAPIGEKQMSVM